MSKGIRVPRIAIVLGLLASGAAWAANAPAAAPKAASAAPQPAQTAQATTVSGVAYDKQKDRISIVVEQHPLSDVLLNIGRQSGIDMRLDPQADGPVTLNIDKLPLESALERLGHLNVIKQYKSVGKGKQKKKLLIRVSVLPEGKTDPDAAVRLMDADKEVDFRSGMMSAAQRAMARHNTREDLMMQRWKARLGDLTPEQKQHYDDRMREFADREAEKEKRNAEAEAQRQQKRDARISQLPPGAQDRARQGHPGVAPDPAKAAQAQQDFPVEKTPSVIYPDQKQ